MTINSKLKKIIRDRMELTNEPYTQARRSILENSIYTVTVLSFSEDKTHGELSARTLAGQLSNHTIDLYGTKVGEGKVVSWLQDSYSTKESLASKAERYIDWESAILIEYVRNFTVEDLIQRIIPNTDSFVLHVTAAEFGRFNEFLSTVLKDAPKKTKTQIKEIVEQSILLIDQFEESENSEDPLNLNHLASGPKMQAALNVHGISLPRLIINIPNINGLPPYNPKTIGKERHEMIKSTFPYPDIHLAVAQIILKDWLSKKDN